MDLRLERTHLWQTLRLLLACGLAEGVGLALGLQETYWSLITTLIVTRPMQAEAKGKGRDRTIAAVIGAIMGLGVLELERHGWPKTPVFIVAFVPLVFVAAVWPNLRFAATTLIVVVLVPSSKEPLVRPLDRVIEIVIGSLAGWLVSALFDSDRLRRRVPDRVAPEAREGE